MTQVTSSDVKSKMSFMAAIVPPLHRSLALLANSQPVHTSGFSRMLLDDSCCVTKTLRLDMDSLSSECKMLVYHAGGIGNGGGKGPSKKELDEFGEDDDNMLNKAEVPFAPLLPVVSERMYTGLPAFPSYCARKACRTALHLKCTEQWHDALPPSALESTTRWLAGRGAMQGQGHRAASGLCRGGHGHRLAHHCA